MPSKIHGAAAASAAWVAAAAVCWAGPGDGALASPVVAEDDCPALDDVVCVVADVACVRDTLVSCPCASKHLTVSPGGNVLVAMLLHGAKDAEAVVAFVVADPVVLMVMPHPARISAATTAASSRMLDAPRRSAADG